MGKRRRVGVLFLYLHIILEKIVSVLKKNSGKMVEVDYTNSIILSSNLSRMSFPDFFFNLD